VGIVRDRPEAIMERNTYATSIYIDVPVAVAAGYLRDGANLGEYTLSSRMRERVDDATWLGTSSGYQADLYYHVRHRDLDQIQIVEWHCGKEVGRYYHVYPMLLFTPQYFGSPVGAAESGTYYHWISFVDPARTNPMISEGLPTVHRAESHSLKAQLERRAGRRRAAPSALELRSHTVYVDAPLGDAVSYLGDPATATEWGFLLRPDGARLFDEYDHPIEIRLTVHDLGEYWMIEHDTHYLETAAVVRTPLLVFPAAYAFAQPAASGVIVHRVTAWPVGKGREVGKGSIDDYDTEVINAKRLLEARAGNLEAYARGCSYLGPRP
jgi:hypothetical protein